MADHNEHACHWCGSYLHHDGRCLEQKNEQLEREFAKARHALESVKADLATARTELAEEKAMRHRQDDQHRKPWPTRAYHDLISDLVDNSASETEAIDAIQELLADRERLKGELAESEETAGRYAHALDKLYLKHRAIYDAIAAEAWDNDAATAARGEETVVHLANPDGWNNVPRCDRSAVGALTLHPASVTCSACKQITAAGSEPDAGTGNSSPGRAEPAATISPYPREGDAERASREFTEVIRTGKSKPAAAEQLYPCDRCGKLRTKAEGGTTFTVCDECWDAHRAKAPAPTSQAAPETAGDVPVAEGGVVDALVIESPGAGVRVLRQALADVSEWAERARSAEARAEKAEAERDEVAGTCLDLRMNLKTAELAKAKLQQNLAELGGDLRRRLRAAESDAAEWKRRAEHAIPARASEREQAAVDRANMWEMRARDALDEAQRVAAEREVLREAALEFLAADINYHGREKPNACDGDRLDRARCAVDDLLESP